MSKDSTGRESGGVERDLKRLVQSERDAGLLAVDEIHPEPLSYCWTCDMGVQEPHQADYHRQHNHEVEKPD